MFMRSAVVIAGLLILAGTSVLAQAPTLVKEDYNVDVAPQNTVAASPALAIDADGRIGFIWSDNRTGFPDIFFRIDAPLSESILIDPTFTAETTPINESMSPACAFDLDGRLATAWTADAVSPTVQEVLATWIDRNGNRIPAAGIFVNQQYTVDTVDAKNPTIGTDGTGQTAFLWSDNRAFAQVGGELRQFHDIWGARLRIVSGAPAFQDDQDFRLNSSFTTKAGARHPAVAVNNNNEYIVCWDEDRVALDDSDDPALRKDIFMRMFAHDFAFDPGAGIVDDVTVTVEDTGTDDATFPDVAVNGNGLLLFVWQNTASGDAGNIHLRPFAANGLPLEDVETVVDQDAGNSLQSRPRVAALSDNNFLITWVDERGNGSAYGRIYNPVSRSFVTAEFQIDNSPGEVITQAVATDGNQSFVTAWHERNPQDAIFANIHSVTSTPILTVDLNQDGNINEADLLLFTGAWHGDGSGLAVSPDFNDNNIVDPLDLFTFAADWQTSPQGKAASFVKEVRMPKSRTGVAYARPRAETETAAGERR